MTTTLEKVLNWGRANAMFPATFGLACCAIEMMSIVSPRYDIARFGAEALRASPRQADFMILSGRVSIKMAPVVRRIYDQMLEPKWAISMGACSSSGGMFANYAVVQGADKFMPVDVHVPGCPPRPEALIYGFNKLQKMVLGNPEPGWRQRYNAERTEEWARACRTSHRRRSARPTNEHAGPRERRRPGGLMPDAPGLELIAQEINDAHDGRHPRHLPRARPGLPDRQPGADRSRLLRLASRHARPGVPIPGQRPRRRLLPRRAALRRPLRAPEHAAGGAGAGSRRARGPRRTTRFPELDSCVELFPTANFQEREVYDFFGIVFRGHPDLRRILMPEDYVGWPQRRDFPIGGEPVIFTHNELDTPGGGSERRSSDGELAADRG